MRLGGGLPNVPILGFHLVPDSAINFANSKEVPKKIPYTALTGPTPFLCMSGDAVQ